MPTKVRQVSISAFLAHVIFLHYCYICYELLFGNCLNTKDVDPRMPGAPDNSDLAARDAFWQGFLQELRETLNPKYGNIVAMTGLIQNWMHCDVFFLLEQVMILWTIAWLYQLRR